MIINASAHSIPLADKSVHAVVTSPPYFGLRRYEGAQDVDWPAGVYSPMTGCPPCVEVPAMRCPLGNESTIEAFIWHLLLVMRELKRVLRDDGTCWINLGDSYSGSGKGQTPNGCNDPKNNKTRGIKLDRNQDEIEGGNLLAIPHRFALAAQADGWTLRNDCVWHKKSAMPESVSGWRFQDGQLRRGSWRHTRAHEYVFQFVKGMGYWSDSEIVKEAASSGFNGSSFTDERDKLTKPGLGSVERFDNGMRNPRSVFSPSPSPYAGSHFATFPKELIRPLILSSVPRRCCPECGQGWAATVQNKPMVIRKTARDQEVGRTQTSGTMLEPARSVTTGYIPTCQCGRSDYKQGILLDPFVGSGTTLEVARECGVKAIGLDISHTYLNEQASWRGLQVARPDFSKMPLFAQQEAA
jgi:DNA modification methylase